MMLKGPQTRVVVSAALAALWLTACGGGGGGGGDAPAVPPPPSAGGSPSAPAPAPAPTAVTVSANTQLQANTAYTVNAPGPVTLTLPATANVGDTVTITGVSATPWTVAQNAGQAILTTSLNGNVAAGVLTPRLTPAPWHWVTSNPTGDVITALDIPGEVHVSTDGGATWTEATVTNAGTVLHGQAWISADMSATADRIVVVGFGGGMYQSTDKGQTFTRIDQAFNPSANLAYESVTVSQDGQRIVAAVMNGSVYYSANGGATFAAATEGGAPLVDAFRAVDSSANGQIVVAASQANVLHLSTNGGATFATVPVTVGGAAVTDTWYRVAMSEDGNTILLAGNTQYPVPGSSTGLYVGRNVGGTWTWTRASTVAGDYTSVSMSADGSIMSATLSGPGTSGQVLMSTDGGQSFSTVTTPPGETTWRAMKLSGDGRSWVLAAGTFFGTPGQLYTTIGGRTTYGTTGSITGTLGNSVELKYQGNGVWNVQSSGGGAFTIR